MQIKKTALLSALSTAGRIELAKKEGAGLIFEGFGEMLRIDVIGQDESIQLWTPCEGTIARTVISPRLFMNAISSCGDEIELARSESSIVVKSGRRKMSVSHFVSSDVVVNPPGNQVVVPADLLLAAIKKSKFSAGSESHRHVLKSIHILGSATRLRVESGSGTEFSIFNAAAICGDIDVLIPTGFIPLFCEMLAEKDAVLLVGENTITARCERGHYTCKLLDGQYPDMSKIDGSGVNEIGVIARDEWLDVFNAIRLMRGADEKLSVRATARFTEKNCDIASISGSPVEESVDGNFSTAEICVNALAISDCLAVLDEGSMIHIGTVPQFNNAVVFRCGDLRVYSSQMLK